MVLGRYVFLLLYTDSRMPKKKAPNKREKKIMSYMAQCYGCIVCRRQGKGFVPASIHHFRSDVGMSQRSKKFIPLCWDHHQHPKYGIHGGTKSWQKKHGTEQELLDYYNSTTEEDYRYEP